MHDSFKAHSKLTWTFFVWFGMHFFNWTPLVMSDKRAERAWSDELEGDLFAVITVFVAGGAGGGGGGRLINGGGGGGAGIEDIFIVN